jgi:hypothetical protein
MAAQLLTRAGAVPQPGGVPECAEALRTGDLPKLRAQFWQLAHLLPRLAGSGSIPLHVYKCI